MYRTKAQAASGGRPFTEESPLAWRYAGSGVWTCSYQSDGRSCRALLSRAGPRLLMASWSLLGNGIESVKHRDVLDRPYSKLQDQGIKDASPVQVDWIGGRVDPKKSGS